MAADSDDTRQLETSWYQTAPSGKYLSDAGVPVPVEGHDGATPLPPLFEDAEEPAAPDDEEEDDDEPAPPPDELEDDVLAAMEDVVESDFPVSRLEHPTAAAAHANPIHTLRIMPPRESTQVAQGSAVTASSVKHRFPHTQVTAPTGPS